MSWSLKLSNGDLTLGGASYGTVTGEQKLVQDLRAYILERRGTDDMHPDFGSTLDGGRLISGEWVPGPIGTVNDSLARSEIEVELRRLAREYQARQLQRAKDDRLVYGKTTLTKREVLLGITSITFHRKTDSLNVTLTLQTGTNEVDLELGIS